MQTKTAAVCHSRLLFLYVSAFFWHYQYRNKLLNVKMACLEDKVRYFDKENVNVIILIITFSVDLFYIL